MATFGRIVNGFVTDVCMGSDAVSAPAAAFVAAYVTYNGPWVAIPDGTHEGSSTSDGQSFTPPEVAPKPVVYQSLSQIGFITLCQEAGGMTDGQLVACQGDGNLAAMWIKFRAADQVDQTDPRVQQGLSALAALGYLPSGVAAVNAAWPKSS